MRKLRSAGFNAIQFYVEWNRHEVRKAEYDFSGRRDIEEFMKVTTLNLDCTAVIYSVYRLYRFTCTRVWERLHKLRNSILHMVQNWFY